MARDFDGSNDVIDHGQVAWATTGTIALWVLSDIDFTPDTSQRYLFDAATDGSSTRYFLWRNSPGPNSWQCFLNGTATMDIDDWLLGAGVWEHWAITWDDAHSTEKQRGYRNGSELATSNATVGSVSEDIQFSGRMSDVSRWDGAMAEIGIWTTRLDADEIAALAARFSPMAVRPPELLYSPYMGRTSPEPDLVTGNNGILTGTAAREHPPIIYPTQPISGFAAAAALAEIPAARPAWNYRLHA